MLDEKGNKPPWNNVIERVRRCLFRVYLGNSVGTGFLVLSGITGGTVQYTAWFATALHVLKESLPRAGSIADIRIVSADGKRVFDNKTSHVGLLNSGYYDTLFVILHVEEPLNFGNDLLPLLPVETKLAYGLEVGWLGFHDSIGFGPCFFHGHIAGHVSGLSVYLATGGTVIDMSGAPAFDRYRIAL